MQNALQQIASVYRIKIDKIFLKQLCEIADLFLLEAHLCILEISQKKDFLRMGDLISNYTEFIVKSNYKLRELSISPDIWSLDLFRQIDAIPAEWRESLTTSTPISNEPLNLQNEI